MFLSLVLSAAASMRCAERVIEIVNSSLGLSLPTPSWCTGRLWLMRVGYFQLTRPKTLANDWVWIVDHTVQIGKEKCLLILGVRLCNLPLAGGCLSHKDVEVIDLVPVRQSNGDIVCQQLEANIEKTGIPREIISDHGTDLNAGIIRFCHRYPQTSPFYDIKHKTAAILKRELGQDADWITFTRLAGQAKRQLQQTPLATLTPPNQKTKARYMNVENLVLWGKAILIQLESPGDAKLLFDMEQVRHKLGWVMDFRSQLEEWGELFKIVSLTESFVRQEGIYAGAHLDLESHIRPLVCVDRTERTKKVYQELMAFVTGEEAELRPRERLLGSSEIIESVLGKLKRLEQDQALSGFTGLVLCVGALVSTTTKEVIQQALETVSTKQVLNWCQEKLGQSVQSKRRETFAALDQSGTKMEPIACGG
jgi:hypothetical protein